MGILFSVHNELGSTFKESYYQKAVELQLIQNKIPYQKEIRFSVLTSVGKVGTQIFDFLIDQKIVLELKAVPFMKPDYYRQLRSYLKANSLELGILANFRTPKLTYKRVLNRV